MSWDKKFMELTRYIADKWSKDRSTKVGAVIVDPVSHDILSVGYNGFPRGVDDDVDSRHERPAKYLYTEHGERNAIYNAARKGKRLEGATIYVPWFPCVDCARGIIQSGIDTVVTVRPESIDLQSKFAKNRRDWGSEFKISQEMFEEAGVKIIWYDNETSTTTIDDLTKPKTHREANDMFIEWCQFNGISYTVFDESYIPGVIKKPVMRFTRGNMSVFIDKDKVAANYEPQLTPQEHLEMLQNEIRTKLMI